MFKNNFCNQTFNYIEVRQSRPTGQLKIQVESTMHNKKLNLISIVTFSVITW